jgi:preprotein translocase subunit SecF
MAKRGLADRLYRGEANLNIVGRRKMWFAAAAVLVLISIGSFLINSFHLGIEFSGGTQIIMPASVGSQADAQNAVQRAIEAADAPEGTQIGAVQRVGSGNDVTYTVRTSSLT